jgi:hypothetical protein
MHITISSHVSAVKLFRNISQLRPDKLGTLWMLRELSGRFHKDCGNLCRVTA